jgi:TonB family protein
VRALVALNLLGWAIGSAHAETSAPPAVDHGSLMPSVRPPEPIEMPVEYPPGAAGEGRVTLHIVVEADGHVSRAEPQEGEEPFRTAAAEAALHFRFAPAERDGRAVAAKIKIEVVFTPPEPEPKPEQPELAAQAKGEVLPVSGASGPAARAQDSRTKPAPASPHAAGPGLVEVRVIGERLAPDAQSLSRAEARMIPGAFGDPLRAVEVLAGVAPAVSGLPYFFVRGAPPGNIGYFVDGVRVPMLWHAFVGPSVLNPATIDKVTLHRGGYPARYGRYAGAILTVDTVVPRSDYQGEASLRVVDGGAMQTLPLSADGRSAVLASGRYAYLGPVVTSMMSNAGIGYWDYQGSARIDLGSHDRLGLLVFGADDDLYRGASRTSTLFHRIDPRYEHDFSDDSHLRVAVAFGTDRTETSKGSVYDTVLTPRMEFHHRFGEVAALRVGSDFNWNRFRLDPTGARYRKYVALLGLVGSRDESTTGSYIDVTWHPTPEVWVSPGLRGDVFHSQGRSLAGIDPRIAARFEATPTLAFEHTLGVAHQSASFIPGIPGAEVMSIREGLQSSLQASSAVELRLPEHSLLSVTAFEAIYDNLADPLGTEHTLGWNADQMGDRVNGACHGLEFFYKRPLSSRVGAIAAYTLSRTTRSYDDVSTLASVDRTHVVTASLVVDPGRNWLLGMRNSLMSGIPTRRGRTYDGGDRTSPFFRMDLRAEKRYKLSERASLSVVAELLNATFSHEVTDRWCNDDGCKEVGIGPIVVPNVGVEAKY